MDLRWVNDHWEEMSYYKLHLSNNHDRLRREFTSENERGRYKTRAIKIGYGNYKTRRWVHDSEFSVLEEIFKL